MKPSSSLPCTTPHLSPHSLLSGLMVTSAFIYHVLHYLHITIDIRNVCVFLAPLFSSLTVIVTYNLTKQLKVCVCACACVRTCMSACACVHVCNCDTVPVHVVGL